MNTILKDKTLDISMWVVGVAVLVSIAAETGTLVERVAIVVGATAMALSVERSAFLAWRRRRQKKAGTYERKPVRVTAMEIVLETSGLVVFLCLLVILGRGEKPAWLVASVAVVCVAAVVAAVLACRRLRRRDRV